MSASRVTVHWSGFPPGVQFVQVTPVYGDGVAEVLGLAISVTTVPRAKLEEQVPGQFIVPGRLVIVPLPEGPRFTYNVGNA